MGRRPVHKYVRKERFESLLYHLVGVRGKVPEDVIEEIQNELWDTDHDTVWMTVQNILRKRGWSKYFNRIGYILVECGFPSVLDKPVNLDDIMIHFDRMSQKFDRGGWERTYFPPLRYVALRLLHYEGAVLNFRIPAVKTDCKIDPLNKIFNILFN